MNAGTSGKGTGVLLTAAAYTALFLAGAVQGLIGSFQYSRNAPAGAILFCVVLLATCLLGAWGMRSASGALCPAVGWIVASFVLSMPVASGSVIITDSAAGRWFLYGGTVCALAGVAVSFVALSSRTLSSRALSSRGRSSRPLSSRAGTRGADERPR